MEYVYFFIKCVVRWSENSVRFENLMGIDFCEILSHSVRYGMYAVQKSSKWRYRQPLLGKLIGAHNRVRVI